MRPLKVDAHAGQEGDGPARLKKKPRCVRSIGARGSEEMTSRMEADQLKAQGRHRSTAAIAALPHRICHRKKMLGGPK